MNTAISRKSEELFCKDGMSSASNQARSSRAAGRRNETERIIQKNGIELKAGKTWRVTASGWMKKFSNGRRKSPGRNRKGNIVAACRECNNRKRSLVPVEWREDLATLADTPAGK